MALLFANDVDLDGNRLLNVTLHQAATATINAALTSIGQLGYDTTLLRAKLYDGVAIRKILQDNDLDPSTNLGGGAASDSKIATQLAIKTYVDALYSGGQLPFIDFDASTQTTFPSGAGPANKYRVSAAGTVQGVALQVMDVFYPRVSTPSTTVATDWVFIQGNVDAASTSILGLVILATLAEIQANLGQNANKVITVAQLNAWEAALGRVRKFSVTQTIAVGSNTITHNLNTSVPQVQTFDANGPILFQWAVASASAITITAIKAKTAVTVVVQG